MCIPLMMEKHFLFLFSKPYTGEAFFPLLKFSSQNFNINSSKLKSIQGEKEFLAIGRITYIKLEAFWWRNSKFGSISW